MVVEVRTAHIAIPAFSQFFGVLRLVQCASRSHEPPVLEPCCVVRGQTMTVLAKAEAHRVRTVTLSDIEMRRDFQAIIADWRERAKKYLSTYSEYLHGSIGTTVEAYLRYLALHTRGSRRIGRDKIRCQQVVELRPTAGTEQLDSAC